eukprot:9325837-Pyramimonas_sp.AAC.2
MHTGKGLARTAELPGRGGDGSAMTAPTATAVHGPSRAPGLHVAVGFPGVTGIPSCGSSSAAGWMTHAEERLAAPVRGRGRVSPTQHGRDGQAVCVYRGRTKGGKANER